MEMSDGRRELNVIIKPTTKCNTACVYCSSYKPGISSAMSLTLVDKFYNELFDYARCSKIKNINILWHGGEPLLLGKKFYQKVWNTSDLKETFVVNHMIQTNLLDVDEEWIGIFKKYNIIIGTSVDPIGGARIYKNRKLQYPDWVEKFILACNNNLNIGIVFTITSFHLDKAQDVYNFFKNIQSFSSKPVNIKFNPAYNSGKAVKGGGDLLTIKPKEYAVFLQDIWILWNDDERQFPVSPFEEWMNKSKNSCEFSGRCHESYLSIDSMGNIFNCGRFLDSDNMFGNINIKRLKYIIKESPLKRELSEREKVLRNGHCKKCSFWEYCKGGCPYFAKIYSGDYLKESPYCSTVKEIFNKTNIITIDKEVYG